MAAGQLVTVDAHEMIVETEVTLTVSVVKGTVPLNVAFPNVGNGAVVFRSGGDVMVGPATSVDVVLLAANAELVMSVDDVLLTTSVDEVLVIMSVDEVLLTVTVEVVAPVDELLLIVTVDVAMSTDEVLLMISLSVKVDSLIVGVSEVRDSEVILLLLVSEADVDESNTDVVIVLGAATVVVEFTNVIYRGNCRRAAALSASRKRATAKASFLLNSILKTNRCIYPEKE